jgi:hypothetical protein
MPTGGGRKVGASLFIVFLSCVVPEVGKIIKDLWLEKQWKDKR